MNFPSSPSVGTQVALDNGLVWTWNGYAWDLNTNFGLADRNSFVVRFVLTTEASNVPPYTFVNYI